MLWDPIPVNGIGQLHVPVHQRVARLYGWASERLYHEWAGYYDAVAWMTSAGGWRRWRRMAWREVRGVRVLELGSGPGHLLVEGKARGLDLIGLELSAEMIAIALRRYGHGSIYVRGDGRVLPFADMAFETVVATFPAGYVLEDTALRECRRVLKPGGAGRLVLVGLWVHLDLAGIERVAPVFYGRPDQERLTRIAERVGQVGFSVSLRAWREGRATIGGLVAETR